MFMTDALVMFSRHKWKDFGFSNLKTFQIPWHMVCSVKDASGFCTLSQPRKRSRFHFGKYSCILTIWHRNTRFGSNVDVSFGKRISTLRKSAKINSKKWFSSINDQSRITGTCHFPIWDVENPPMRKYDRIARTYNWKSFQFYWELYFEKWWRHQTGISCRTWCEFISTVQSWVNLKSIYQ